jgi:hypothetical protein
VVASGMEHGAVESDDRLTALVEAEVASATA